MENKKLFGSTLYAVVESHYAVVYPPNIFPNSDFINVMVVPLLSHLV